MYCAKPDDLHLKKFTLCNKGLTFFFPTKWRLETVQMLPFGDRKMVAKGLDLEQLH